MTIARPICGRLGGRRRGAWPMLAHKAMERAVMVAESLMAGQAGHLR